MFPESGLTRSLSIQSVLYAIGDGVFSTGNAVYFTQIVGLSAAQVGLGLSLSALVVLALSVPMGRLADRFGPQRMWSVGSGLEALLYLSYPFIHGFAAFLALLTLFSIVASVGGAGRGAYTISIFSREARVRSQAYMRSALNVGFTVGAMLGGLALATDSHTVIRLVPVLTAVVLLANSVMISRFPHVRSASAASTPGTDDAVRTVTPPALRNRGFAVTSVLSGIVGTHWILLTVVIPLWLVERTDAPHWTLAWLFGTNTVLCVLFQVSAARGADTIPGALRGVRLGAAFMVASCLVIAVTGDTIGWVSVVLLLAGHMTVTGAELFESAATWGFLSELSDPFRRGEYQGVWGMGGRITNILGPAAYTWLALDHGTLGWAVIAAIILLAAVLLHPAVRAAERFLTTHALDASGSPA